MPSGRLSDGAGISHCRAVLTSRPNCQAHSRELPADNYHSTSCARPRPHRLAFVFGSCATPIAPAYSTIVQGSLPVICLQIVLGRASPSAAHEFADQLAMAGGRSRLGPLPTEPPWSCLLPARASCCVTMLSLKIPTLIHPQIFQIRLDVIARALCVIVQFFQRTSRLVGRDGKQHFSLCP